MNKYTETAVVDLLTLLRLNLCEVKNVLANYKTLYVISEFANTLKYSRQVAKIRGALDERLVFIHTEYNYNTSDAALNEIVRSELELAYDTVDYVSDMPRITAEEAKELVASIYGSSHLGY